MLLTDWGQSQLSNLCHCARFLLSDAQMCILCNRSGGVSVLMEGFGAFSHHSRLSAQDVAKPQQDLFMAVVVFMTSSPQGVPMQQCTVNVPSWYPQKLTI